MKITISEIANTLEHYKAFLMYKINNDAMLHDYCSVLKDENAKGNYESFMRKEKRYSDYNWWTASCINYIDLTIGRVKSGDFKPSHLTKLDANSTAKKKTQQWKNELVDGWVEYCSDKKGVNVGTFELIHTGQYDIDWWN